MDIPIMAGRKIPTFPTRRGKGFHQSVRRGNRFHRSVRVPRGPPSSESMAVAKTSRAFGEISIVLLLILLLLPVLLLLIVLLNPFHFEYDRDALVQFFAKRDTGEGKGQQAP